MSGGSAEILQSYLVSVGYQTDAVSLRKFEDGLTAAGKKVLNVGTTVAGAVLAVEAATAAFAYNMRKVYFEAELAQTPVKNMKALEYAGKQFGISSETMAGSVKNMASALRLNPGLTEYLKAFGVKVDPNNIGKATTDMVRALKDMPEFQGAQIAQMFGMDADTFHLWKEHIDEMTAKEKEYLELQKKMGIDPEKQKGVILAYTTALDKLEMRLSSVGQLMLANMVGPFQTAARWSDHILEGWGSIFGGELGVNIYNKLHGGSAKGPSSSGKITTPNHVFLGGRLPGEMTNLPSGKGLKAQLNAIESRYNLPPGLLTGTWGAESSFGKKMLSPAGAKGHMGFMDATAKQYGVSDPNDLNQSATGTAKMYQYLLKKYKGNAQHAMYAYNWGEGNVDSWLKTGKGVNGQPMPAETAGYPSRVASFDSRLGAGGGGGVQMAQTTNINVNGTDAASTAKMVTASQDRVNGNMVRDMKVAMR
jgi:hypothetical protein